MTINELAPKPELVHDPKLETRIKQFDNLLIELRKKPLPDNIIKTINLAIDELNVISLQGNLFKSELKKKQAWLIKTLEKDLKLVPKNYYRNLWLPLGMTAFGLPLGVAIGSSIGNMGLLAVGLPIGMAIGIAVGVGLDKKANKEGRQLDIELK